MKTGLVLSGGGSRGAYEVGVWKALDELNIKCDIVTGTSIGSINAIMYVQGLLDESIEFWKTIDFNSVFDTSVVPKNNRELIRKYLKYIRNGGKEPTNLEKILDKYIDIDKVYSSDIDYGLCTVKYQGLVPVEICKNEIPKNKLIDYIIASCTVYPVFKTREIESNKYVDGGIKNPVPISLAKKMGADKLIIVNISLVGRKMKIKEDENTIVIKPKFKLCFPLNFDKDISSKYLKYGYNDTIKKFKKYYGKRYTFKDVNYKESIQFRTLNSYINTMEYLGKLFNIDDTKIYSYSIFNRELFKNISKYELKDNIRFKDLLNSKERIIFTYNNLKKEKRINSKRLFHKEYIAAYYLYINM